MGSGSSSAAKAASTTPTPICPLFYNYTPNKQLIPAVTLPTRDTNGNVRRPVGGCSARVIALRALPVVTPEAMKQAKSVVTGKPKRTKAKAVPEGENDDNAAEAELPSMDLETARGILQEPHLPPSVSSCFLVNLAVDEQGRLAPLSSGGAASVMDTLRMAGAVISSEDESATCLSPTQSSQHPLVRKGFNFEAAHQIALLSPRSLQSPTTPEKQLAPTEPRRLDFPEAPTKDAAHHDGQNPLGLLPSPTVKRPTGPPASLGFGASSATSREGMPVASLFNTSLLPSVGHNNGGGDFSTERSDTTSPSISLRSLLVKESKFRRVGETMDPSSVTPLLCSSRDTSVPRQRRQNPRITLLHVPNRTRWFLFNDSASHEAQVTVTLCYLMPPREVNAEGAASTAVSPFAASGGGSPSKDNAASAAVPAEGALKMTCVPTPLSRVSTSPADVKKQMKTMSSSSRSYVELQTCTVPEFVTSLSNPSSEKHKAELAVFKEHSSRMAALRLFVVLAPGATVYLAEGEAAGYRVDTRMIPFDQSYSMAVLGRLLTPNLVQDLKMKSATATKHVYDYGLVYLADPGAEVYEKPKKAEVPTESQHHPQHPASQAHNFTTKVTAPLPSPTTSSAPTSSASQTPPRARTALPPLKHVAPPPVGAAAAAAAAVVPAPLPVLAVPSSSPPPTAVPSPQKTKRKARPKPQSAPAIAAVPEASIPFPSADTVEAAAPPQKRVCEWSVSTQADKESLRRPSQQPRTMADFTFPLDGPKDAASLTQLKNTPNAGGAKVDHVWTPTSNPQSIEIVSLPSERRLASIPSMSISF